MNTNLTKKFFYVSFTSTDGVKFKELFIGETPTTALENAKKANPRKKNFKVGQTAYNTLGEKF